MGQFHLGPLMGLELQRASYGPKDVMGHRWAKSYNGLESYWMAQMTLLGQIPVGRELAGCKWATCKQAVNRLSVGRPATFWPSQMGRPFHRNGPLLGRATCRRIIGAFCPMSGWHLSQRWVDKWFLWPMRNLHVENPHWSWLLAGY